MTGYLPDWLVPEDRFPTWIKPYLPAPAKHTLTIGWSETHGWYHLHSTGVTLHMDSLRDAIDKAKATDVKEWAVHLSPTILENPVIAGFIRAQDVADRAADLEAGEEPSEGGPLHWLLPDGTISTMFIPVPDEKDKDGYRTSMVSSRRWDEEWQHLQEYFQQSHKSQKDWWENQESILHAYNFINTHPAFWGKTTPSYAPAPLWEDEMGAHLIETVVYAEEGTGRPLIGLETGPHQDEFEFEFGKRYLDLDLAVARPTYEEALIELARRLYRGYTCCGEERAERLTEVGDTYADDACWFTQNCTPADAAK